MAGNRVELWGRLAAEPELRVSPAGTAVLRILVDCGEPPGQLRIGAVMTGPESMEVARRLRRERPVRVKGRLRKIGAGEKVFEIEVIATSVEPDNDD